jgi:rod shape-determining protein MreC
VLLSLVLMFADSRFDYLSKLRYYTAVLVTPVHFVAAVPARISEWVAAAFSSRTQLMDENAALKDQLLELQFRLQKLEHLSAENRRLNALLNASSDVEERVVRAQLMGESPDPFSKRILINKGANDGVYIGQPVLDADGLMGQVTEVESLQSWVLLITDPQHSTPIQINRNGTRAVASGTRDTLHTLTLVNVPNTADIETGDLLVTSGLGQRFPAGFPVGVVSSVRVDPGKPFAEVLVQPTANIDRSRNLLLVFSDIRLTMPEAAEAAFESGELIRSEDAEQAESAAEVVADPEPGAAP